MKMISSSSSSLHNNNSRRVKVTLISFLIICSLIIVSVVDIDFSFPFSFSSTRTISPLEDLIKTLRSKKQFTTTTPINEEQSEEKNVLVAVSPSSSTLSNYVKFLLSSSVVDRWKNIFDVDILISRSSTSNSASSLLDSSDIFPCHKEMMMAWTMKLSDKTPKELPSCFSDIKTFLKSIKFFV